MTASWSKGRNKKYPYYRCIHCKGVNIKRDTVEGKFYDFLQHHTYKPELKEMLAMAIEANLEHKQQSNKKRTTQIEKQIFSKCKIKPEDITDETVKPVIEELKNFVIKIS